MAVLSRRNLLTGAASAAAAATSLTVAGCGKYGDPGRSGGRRTTLTFWSWVPGVRAAVDLWNRRNPNIQVELDNIVPGPSGGYAKLHAAIRAGGAPDLAQIEYQQLPAFLLDDGLLDLAPYGADEHRKLFVAWQWRQGVVGDRVYAVPQASGPMAMYYRKDLFDRWGIPVPVTWAGFEQAARKVRQAAPGSYLTAFPPGNSAWFIALAWQAGARWFGASGDAWTVNLAGATSRRVAGYWDRLRRADLIKLEQDMQNGWFADLQAGRIVAWVGPQWGDALLAGNAAGTAGRWRVAPMPQWTDPAAPGARPAASNWGGSSTAIMKDTRHPRAALAFAIWLNSNLDSVNLLIKGGYGWPALAGAYDRTVLNRPSPFFGGQRYNEVFAAADRQVDDSWLWPPTFEAVYQDLNNGFGAAIESGKSFVDVLGTAQRHAVDALRAKGLRARAG